MSTNPNFLLILRILKEDQSTYEPKYHDRNIKDEDTTSKKLWNNENG